MLLRYLCSGASLWETGLSSLKAALHIAHRPLFLKMLAYGLPFPARKSASLMNADFHPVADFFGSQAGSTEAASGLHSRSAGQFHS